MKEAPHLTRWNHAGLNRFRYVNGNAATYLEALRRLLADSFPEWNEYLCTELRKEFPGLDTTVPIGEDVDVSQANARMLAQYQAGRRDWAWEIVRTFARACYMLTEHIDAYANEAYLGTATQWDNLYRLVKMLDYHPKPAASASALLVLQAKPGKSGVVEQGFQVKNAPEDGSAPVIFETLEDIVIDSALNEIRLENWNNSPIALLSDPKDPETDWKWVKATGEDIADLNLSVGQPVLLLKGSGANPNERLAASVKSVDLAKGEVIVELKVGQQVTDWKKGNTRLLAGPQSVRRFHLNGTGVVKFKSAHGLSTGQVVALQNDAAWRFSRILESNESAVRLEPVNPLPNTASSIYLAYRITRPIPPGDFGFPIFIKAFWWNAENFQDRHDGTIQGEREKGKGNKTRQRPGVLVRLIT